MTEYALEESHEIEQKLIARLTAKYAETRQGIHVSDLVLCLRQSLARKIDPKPPTLTQLMYYLDGARRHETLQELYGEGVIEKAIDFEGVQGHIDIYDNQVIEFKSTRANQAISDHWLRQLSFYMVATHSYTGILQVQRINEKHGNPFPAYKVTMTPEMRERALQEFRERRLMFETAYEKADLSLAPIFRGESQWLCRDCAYRAKCDDIEGL